MCQGILSFALKASTNSLNTPEVLRQKENSKFGPVSKLLHPATHSQLLHCGLESGTINLKTQLVHHIAAIVPEKKTKKTLKCTLINQA